MDLDMLTTKIMAKIMDVPHIHGNIKRSEIMPTKLLCSEGDFAAFEIGDRWGAIWSAHVDVVDTEEEFIRLLNKHELKLLEFGVHR